mmetsp:Transcript_22643/g.63621  ORF Transcript_22643/g.63621 Transcript_22643/m.63621 type:complete len:99 (+) Transcript_22643:243-539(+)
MALLCDCLYRGACQPVKKGCAYFWLFLFYICLCIFYTPTVIIGVIGIGLFYPCHKICEDTCCDTVIWNTCYIWAITYCYYWKWIFSRDEDIRADDDVY